jgi:hypothetical protein
MEKYIKASVSEKERELIDLMLKKASVTEDKILRIALKKWVNNNLDLLTPTELKQYEDILTLPKS